MSRSFVPIIIFCLVLFSCKSSKRNRIDPADIVIREARSYVGVPYRYGGTNRSGMDCSGLLLRSFEVIDLSIPRTSKDQARIGDKVKIKKLKKGDLVFFALGKKRRRITHVGLVTDIRSDSNVRFIHASTSLGVVEANLLSEYYRKNFITARRILD